MYQIEYAVKKFLDHADIHYQYNEATHSHMFGVSWEDENIGNCVVAVTAHDEEDLGCHMSYDVRVPAHARERVVEYLTRANYGLFLGNFQMDMDDGQIIYQVGTAFYDHAPAVEEVARMVHVVTGMAERYSHGLHDVICGKLTPEEAIAEAEGILSFADEPHEETGAPKEAPPIIGEYKELLSALTGEQLEKLADAVEAEMAFRLGETGKMDAISEEYRSIVTDLEPFELAKLSLSVMSERIDRMESFEDEEEDEDAFDEAMSTVELERRKASASLKEKLRMRLSGSSRRVG